MKHFGKEGKKSLHRFQCVFGIRLDLSSCRIQGTLFAQTGEHVLQGSSPWRVIKDFVARHDGQPVFFGPFFQHPLFAPFFCPFVPAGKGIDPVTKGVLQIRGHTSGGRCPHKGTGFSSPQGYESLGM